VDVDGDDLLDAFDDVVPLLERPPEMVQEPIETTNLGSGIWS